MNEQHKKDLELATMEYLNDRQDQGNHVYSIDGYNILHIYCGRHGWECRWRTMATVPNEIIQAANKIASERVNDGPRTNSGSPQIVT